MRYGMGSPRLGAPRAESLPRRRSVYSVRHDVTDTAAAKVVVGPVFGAAATIALLESRALWCRVGADIPGRRPPDLDRRVCQRPLR